MALPRQECWSELLFPSPGGLPDSGTERSSPALAGRFFTTQPAGNLDVTSQCCELSSFPFTFTCFLLCYSCSWTIFCSSRGAPRGQNPQLTYDLHLPRHLCTVPWVLVSDSWVNDGVSERVRVEPTKAVSYFTFSAYPLVWYFSHASCSYW